MFSQIKKDHKPITQTLWKTAEGGDTQVLQLFERFVKSYGVKDYFEIKPVASSLKMALEAILYNPYYDVPRILDEYTHDKLLRNEFVRAILVDCGFAPGTRPRSLVLPYEKPISRLVMYRDLLDGQLNKLKDHLDVNIRDFMDFPNISNYVSIFGLDLSQKQVKDERAKLKITYDDVMTIKANLNVSSLEEYVTMYGINPIEFQRVCGQAFTSRHKLKEFYTLLRNLWVECNVLRKVFMFLNQSFNDEISLANLAEKQSENAKTGQAVPPSY